MGVLVGTSLIVIIPEGVDTLYSSKAVQHQHKRDSAGRALDIKWEGPYVHPLLRDEPVFYGDALAGPVLDKRGSSGTNPPKTPTEEGVVGILGSDQKSKVTQEKQDTQKATESEEGGHKESSPHTWVGISLVSGFILMYLIDKLPQFASSSSKQPQRYHISLDNLGSGIGRGSSSSHNGGLLEPSSSPRQRSGFATTTGLVIHAAADGIALGASSSNTNLSFIIFFAIMVHKAPASFGLTSVLLKQGLSSRAIRGHLLIFSLAAPVGALATWFIAHTLRANHTGDESGVRWRTGMLLLFSAGTFLYVLPRL
jgi:zinc transporter 9